MTTTLPDYEPEEKEHRVDIEIGRPDISQTRIIETIQQPLVENQARLRVDKFGFSTNNITYAVVGEMLSYWDFFPAQPQGPDDTTGWGRVPVWGFATVVESRSDDVEVGERLFGYLPMSPELVITVGKANPHSVNDVSEHRAHLHNAYNSLRRCSTDPIYAEASEDLQMLLYPLFFTSFVIDDFLADNLDFGAEQIVISSASSKTSLGAAFLFKARGITTVGMTSEANRSFTEGLGLYDQVVTGEHKGPRRCPPASCRGPGALDDRRRHTLGGRVLRPAVWASRPEAGLPLRTHSDRQADAGLGNRGAERQGGRRVVPVHLVGPVVAHA